MISDNTHKKVRVSVSWSFDEQVLKLESIFYNKEVFCMKEEPL